MEDLRLLRVRGPRRGNCRRCPRTAEIVESIPGMTTALFSVLLPHKHIPPHRGPWKGVLRYHLALRTPADETAADIRVGNRIEHRRDGRSMISDCASSAVLADVAVRLSQPSL